MIDLDEGYLTLVQKILAEEVPEYEVRVFGSRVKETAKPYSDLDLVLVGEKPLQPTRLFSLKNRFSETNLPILIDIVERKALDESFRKVVDEKNELIQKAFEG